MITNVSCQQMTTQGLSWGRASTKTNTGSRRAAAQRDAIKWGFFSRLFIAPLFTSEQSPGSERRDISVSYRYGLYWAGALAVPWCPVKVLRLLISSSQARTLLYLWAEGCSPPHPRPPAPPLPNQSIKKDTGPLLAFAKSSPHPCLPLRC